MSKKLLRYGPKSMMLAVAAALAFSSPAAMAETLEEAMVSAYNSNPTILARRAFLRAIDEGVPVAMAGWRPTVNFSADIGTGRFESNTVSGGDGKWRTSKSVGLAVSQFIYRGGRTVAEVNESDNTAMAERYQLQSIVSTELLNVVTAYMNALRDQAVLELNTSNEMVLRRQLEAAEDRFRVGEITRTDVAQAEARLSGAIADRIAQQGTLEATRASYQKTVGYLPGVLDAPKPIDDMLPVSLDESVDLAVMNNPQITSAEYVATAAQHAVELVRGELRPELRVDGTAERTWRQSSQTSRTESVAVVATLDVPLYQAGNVYARIREAKHTAGQRRIEVETNRREVVEAATAAWENLKSAKAQVESFRAQITAAEIALEGVQRESEVGSRTILDVLDSEQELLDARVSLVQAERDVWIASYTLLSAVGGLTPEKLGLPVKIYDPNVHYREVRNKWIGSHVDADRDAGEGLDEDYYYIPGEQTEKTP